MQQLPVPPATSPCKVCATPAILYGVVDFSRSCEEHRGKVLPLSGIAVYYRRCQRCGLLFTSDFDGWSADDFRANIYNDAYIAVDPDYAEQRPAGNAQFVAQMFAAHRASISVLDFGGGNGVLMRALRQAGFTDCASYDPFDPASDVKPQRRFDLVTCFETLEHSPRPLDTIAEINALLEPGGMVLFSTLLQPPDFDQIGLGWWYAGPRNGHVTLFSQPALALAWQSQGLAVNSANANQHIAYRTVPAFARHLFQ